MPKPNINGEITSKRGPSVARKSATPSAARHANVANLLGGARVLKREVRSDLDVHEIVARGIAGQAIVRVLEGTTALKQRDIAPALGMSLRTVQRLAPNKPLTKEQGGRAWKLAEILEHATVVFGSRERAEQWLAAPAVALNQKSPIELMSTIVGTELVEQLLGRLEYGVYT